MVRALQSLTDAGEEIRNLPPGTVIQLRDDHDAYWRFFFANGDSFLTGDGTFDCFTLRYPDGKVFERQDLARRLIPHIDGPIIEGPEGSLTQQGKAFCHPHTPTLDSRPSVSRDTRGLTVHFPDGRESVDVTALVPGLNDYDRLERHRHGLMISRGNNVWLVTPGAKLAQVISEPEQKASHPEVVEG